jgi:Rad3-related DNA helicase
LSLLCASLAWLKSEREKFKTGEIEVELPKIIYCSRTHSQLAQVQKELANTVFEPRTVLIASRDHLCVNQSINMNKGFALKGSVLNAACRKAQKRKNPCIFYKNRDTGKTKMPWKAMDIEELHKIAQREEYCPYFANKDRASAADLIFMPYNYLIDEKIQKSFEIEYANSIIIFDEAHNVASTVEDVFSFELKAKFLEDSLRAIHQLQEQRRKIQQEQRFQYD